jgi:hypothetical protein
MPTVVPAEGAILEHILETTASTASPGHEGLTRKAFATFEAAQMKTAWGSRHQRRFALVDGSDVLASAQTFALNGMLDGRPVSIRGIGAVAADPAHHDGDDAQVLVERVLVERLLDDATREGADMALLFVTEASRTSVPDGFEVVPITESELAVVESERRGAPMVLVRSGEDRDLPAIVSMGQARAERFRFHLERDTDLVKYAITRRRLLAGLGTAGERQLHFVIAEEGITAAAYVVVSVADQTWTIEECGDRDASGARVGAILQTLIAGAPVERRPVIRGWLPPAFVPPQISILSARPATELVMMRGLQSTPGPPALVNSDVLYWRSDLF